MKHCKNTGLLILRLVVGGLFLTHALPKFSASPEMAGFLGGAFHNLGLTFLSVDTWTLVLAIAETLAGALIILGFGTRVGTALMMAVMISAMNTKGFEFPNIEIDLFFFGTALALMITGAGRYSLDACCCKKDNKACCGGSCHSDKKKTNKEVIEA